MPMETKEPMAGGDDLYSDGADTAATDEETKSPDKPDEQQDDATEAVLPKSILAGKEFNVGDEVVLTVTGIHDDQISVKYATAKGGDESKDDGGMDKAEMPSDMGGGGDGDYE